MKTKYEKLVENLISYFILIWCNNILDILGEIKYIIKIMFTCWILPFEKVATRKSPSKGITHIILLVSIFLEQVVRNAGC